MKIAVTGASGFIGSNLSRHLRDHGHDIVGLVRSTGKAKDLAQAGLPLRVCDVTDANALNAAFDGVDAVIHLAALFNRPEAPWNDYHRVNVNGTRNVLLAASQNKVKRVIHCSTIGVAVGDGDPPFSERTAYSPPSWDKYETTKCDAEKLALSFHRDQGLPVVVIRPAQVYGPGDRGKAKFYRMIRKGIIVNPGKTMKHLIYIDDLCRAFELALEKNEAIGEIFIIAGAHAISLRELIGIAAKELGVNPPKIILPATPMTWLCAITETICNVLGIRPVLFRRSMDFFTKSVEFDVTRASAYLGFESEVGVRNGVAKTVAWYKKMGLV